MEVLPIVCTNQYRFCRSRTHSSWVDNGAGELQLKGKAEEMTALVQPDCQTSGTIVNFTGYLGQLTDDRANGMSDRCRSHAVHSATLVIDSSYTDSYLDHIN